MQYAPLTGVLPCDGDTEPERFGIRLPHRDTPPDRRTTIQPEDRTMARTDALDRIRKTLENRRKELRKRMSGDLSELGIDTDGSIGDSADAAFESTGDELASQLAELEARELAQIDFALRRLAMGKYGLCAGCASKIPVARLNALPYSTMCIACQREAEKDSSWLADRVAEDWSAVNDGTYEREVNLSQLSYDLDR
jgi:DnaK suppressor protein